MLLLILLLSLVTPALQVQPSAAKQLTGAWEVSLPDGTQGLWIIEDDHFSITYYKTATPEFINTEGGKWSLTKDGNIDLQWEFNTRDPELVGQRQALAYKLQDNTLVAGGKSWKRIDNGTPGELKGAWLITGREQSGKMNAMTPGARKTMKILSGTRFQWIAYNSETGDFFGTGGGSYTTRDGKYTENIEFFSRDNARVGASLDFNYELRDGKWHHSGNNSKGEPLYEIWSTRQSVGI
ncbi:membrane or secreted protein [Cesiribacter sp. SM1]|uniref:membrane or secreted protein n=1 Tax=Cesiribacter sp. SM1 TaxID=2861196 RepID=UPI001CD815C8|nr:membrane or secreted protein [Cesiribacter sp. SM1]